MALYLTYYENQIGGGVTQRQQFHTVYNQRGHGVGGFLKGLYRSVYPILQRVARPIGNELWHAGVSVLDDVLTHKADLKKSLETRLTESGHRLKRKAVDNLETLWNNRGGGGSTINPKKKRRRKKRKIQKGSGVSKLRVKKQKSLMNKKKSQKGSGRQRVKKQKTRGVTQKGRGKKKKKNTKKNNIKKKKLVKKKKKRDVYDIFS